MRYMKFQDNVNFESYKLLCTIARSLNSVITTFTIKTYPRYIYIYIYVSFTFKSRLLRLKCHVHISSRGRSSEHHFFFLFLEIDFSSI